ncbi:MAG TPA: hypothetical protein IGS37_02285 [Synechococcales cyanobacterium M55_K2018_004]|nr:hypothetical protein [Synechococcales cyanobacterium M55_K2018_004]
MLWCETGGARPFHTTTNRYFIDGFRMIGPHLWAIAFACVAIAALKPA